MKETSKLIKSDLKTLIKKFSKNDVVSKINENYSKENIKYINNNEIEDNEYLKEAIVDDNEILKIKDSLIEHGIYNPFYVIYKENHYEVIIGRRRLMASKLIGTMYLPCIILNLNKEEELLTILSDIVDHRNVNKAEQSLILNVLYDEFGYKLKDLSTILSQSIPQVSNIINLKKMPSEIFLALNNFKVSYGNVKVLIGLNDDEAMYYYHKIINENLSVRESERLIKNKNKNISENILNFDDSKLTLTVKCNKKRDYKKIKKELIKLINK